MQPAACRRLPDTGLGRCRHRPALGAIPAVGRLTDAPPAGSRQRQALLGGGSVRHDGLGLASRPHAGPPRGSYRRDSVWHATQGARRFGSPVTSDCITVRGPWRRHIQGLLGARATQRPGPHTHHQKDWPNPGARQRISSRSNRLCQPREVPSVLLGRPRPAVCNTGRQETADSRATRRAAWPARAQGHLPLRWVPSCLGHEAMVPHVTECPDDTGRCASGSTPTSQIWRSR